MATFLVDSSYFDSWTSFNDHLSTMATFFCPPGCHYGKVQLYWDCVNKYQISYKKHFKTYLTLSSKIGVTRVQRKSVLQPAFRASCSYHELAHKSFQLAPKPFLISRIDYNPSVIWISPKHSTCLSGKLRTEFTSPIAKSTSPRQSDKTFFACCATYTDTLMRSQ